VLCAGTHIRTHTHIRMQCARTHPYEVATIRRTLRIKSLFRKRALQKRQYSAKENCNFKEPTNRSHPIHSCEHAQN